MARTGPSPTLQRAMELMRQGLAHEAEALLLEAAREAEEQHGPRSYESAVAHDELGSFMWLTGARDRALVSFRHAARFVPDPSDVDQLREALTFALNLGEMLGEAGDLGEAEAVLRDGLARRGDLYGRAHPGYAFALEPLAQVLLRRGQPEAALESADEAVAILDANEHPRVAAALALRAEVAQALGRPLLPFGDGFGELPDERVVETAGEVVRRLERVEPVVGVALVEGLLPEFAARLGGDHSVLVDLLSALSNLERDRGARAGQERALRRLIELREARGEEDEVVRGLLAVALVRSETGRPAEAGATYAEAVARARAAGDGPILARALRNAGLQLAETGATEEAEASLREAVTAARPDAQLQARARIALGVFLQHADRGDEAALFLSKALELLDDDDPDGITARTHLRALRSGEGCGCGDAGAAAMARALTERVSRHLPDDLLDEIAFEPDEAGEAQLQVRLRREPTADEAALLDRVLRHALRELRERLQ